MGALDNRPADNWRSLYAIADLAGQNPASGGGGDGAGGRASIQRAVPRDVAARLSRCIRGGRLAGEDDGGRSRRGTARARGAALGELRPERETDHATGARPNASRFGIRTGTLHPERKNGYSAVDFTGPWSQYLPSPESAEKGAAPHPPLVRTVRTVRTPGNIDDLSNPNRAYEDPVRTSEIPSFCHMKSIRRKPS